MIPILVAGAAFEVGSKVGAWALDKGTNIARALVGPPRLNVAGVDDHACACKKTPSVAGVDEDMQSIGQLNGEIDNLLIAIRANYRNGDNEEARRDEEIVRTKKAQIKALQQRIARARDTEKAQAQAQAQADALARTKAAEAEAARRANEAEARAKAAEGTASAAQKKAAAATARKLQSAATAMRKRVESKTAPPAEVAQIASAPPDVFGQLLIKIVDKLVPQASAPAALPATSPAALPAASASPASPGADDSWGLGTLDPTELADLLGTQLAGWNGDADDTGDAAPIGSGANDAFGLDAVSGDDAGSYDGAAGLGYGGAAGIDTGDAVPIGSREALTVQPDAVSGDWSGSYDGAAGLGYDGAGSYDGAAGTLGNLGDELINSGDLDAAAGMVDSVDVDDTGFVSGGAADDGAGCNVGCACAY